MDSNMTVGGLDVIELMSFPDELLERILSYCVLAPLSAQDRPAWHRTVAGIPSASPDVSPPPDKIPRGRLAPLLTCKRFLCISTPLFYDTIRITTKQQLRNLLDNALRPNAGLPLHIRRLILGAVWGDTGEILQLCGPNLHTLEIMLDSDPIEDSPICPLRQGLMGLKNLKHFILRKPANLYLTLNKVRYVMQEIATSMLCWDKLEVADIALRLCDDTNPSTLSLVMTCDPSIIQQLGPVTALTLALSTRPCLHTFSTVPPSLWNEAILRVSNNQAIERIILSDSAPPKQGLTSHHRQSISAPGFSPPQPSEASAVLMSGLFMMRAKKHARLYDLIRVGTPISRSRAHTLGGPAYPPTASSSGSVTEMPFQSSWKSSKESTTTTTYSSVSEGPSSSAQESEPPLSLGDASVHPSGTGASTSQHHTSPRNRVRRRPASFFLS